MDGHGADIPLAALMAAHGLPPAFGRTVEAGCRPLARYLAAEHIAAGRPLIVGLCGAQGGGKSTWAAVVAALLAAAGRSAAVLSLDDLYLPPEARARLAATVHPLLRTRGVPGTHDVVLGMDALDALVSPARPHAVRLPRFDKAADAPAPQQTWPEAMAPVDVVLFEGWCVGARPQPEQALATPVNALERLEDADGRWRRLVNARLAGDYQRLFARLDRLVLLQAPSFERVLAWRTLQEQKLAARLASAGNVGGEPRRRAMGAVELERFVMHYERLTRHILAEMPGRADVVVALGAEREVEGLRFRA